MTTKLKQEKKPGILLSIDVVRTDGGTQPRAAIVEATVVEYVAAMKAGAVFPPVAVFHDGKDYWLADGFHRLDAVRRAGRKQIRADVREGTCRDAILFAAGANSTHGLPRTNADKNRAVTTLLGDEEWSQWSNRKIARLCAVSEALVRSLRTVRSEDGSPGPAVEGERRTYTTKHGTTATMKTARINAGRVKSTAQPATPAQPAPQGDTPAAPEPALPAATNPQAVVSAQTTATPATQNGQAAKPSQAADPPPSPQTAASPSATAPAQPVPAPAAQPATAPKREEVAPADSPTPAPALVILPNCPIARKEAAEIRRFRHGLSGGEWFCTLRSIVNAPTCLNLSTAGLDSISLYLRRMPRKLTRLVRSVLESMSGTEPEEVMLLWLAVVLLTPAHRPELLTGLRIDLAERARRAGQEGQAGADR